MVHKFRLSGVVLHAENRYTLLCKCCTALIFVVLSGVIHPYVCSMLYGSYGGLTLYLANSPCSSVAWLLGGVRHVIRSSEHLLTALLIPLSGVCNIAPVIALLHCSCLLYSCCFSLLVSLHIYFRYLFSELYTPDSVSVTLPDSHTILHNLVSCFHFSVAVLCPAASYSVGITFTNTVTTMLLLFLLRCCRSVPYHNACNSILQTLNQNYLRISTHKKRSGISQPLLCYSPIM